MEKEDIENYLSKIQNARWNNFPAVSKHLFDYLDKFIDENETLQKYEESRKKWEDWPNGPRSSFGAQWSLPEDGEDCKTLAYDVYKSIVESKDQGTGLSFELFKNQRFEDNVYDMNNTFLPYLAEAMTDIINDPSVPKKSNDQAANEEIREGVVFIIHGHDELMKREVQLVLERANIKSVVLHERPDRGRTIIEKLEQESEFATYAIALFSPDDKAEDGQLRARQNVILEVGYFIGKLSRAKVRILKKSDVEIPSDLQGVIYDPFDDSGSWKVKLMKELREAGFNPDVDNVLDSF